MRLRKRGESYLLPAETPFPIRKSATRTLRLDTAGINICGPQEENFRATSAGETNPKRSEP